MENMKSLRAKKLKPNHFESIRGTKQIIRKNNTPYTVRDHRDRFFFPDEWMAFYDKLNLLKQKITFRTLINTGARITEIRNIKVSDIDFERRGVVLRVTKRIINKPAWLIKKKGKGEVKGVRKIRVVNVSTQFIKFLKKVVRHYNLEKEDYLPILSIPGANTCMKTGLKRAGIKDWDMFSLHNVRKTLETWLIALGVDSFNIVKHFGHSINIAMKHYVSPDIFSWEEKKQIRMIIGDLYEKRSI